MDNGVIKVWSVAVPGPFAAPLDYLPADSWVHPLHVGYRVLVPLGKRQVVGFVLGEHVLHKKPAFSLRAVIEVMESATALPQSLLLFYQRAAKYYHYLLGEALRTTVPAFLRTTKPYALIVPDVAYALTALGRQQSALHNSRAPLQSQALQAMVQHGHLTQPRLAALNIPKAVLKRLEEKKWVHTQPVNASMTPTVRPGQVLQANEEQVVALCAIAKQLDYNCFVLDGVTGSGKTEVYLQAMCQHVVAQKQVLFLVPEISLVPQTVARLEQRFAACIVMWHSKVSEKKRRMHWQQVQSGEATVVVGTRSALFLPFKKLAMVVVDESHDASYKQATGFRYHARDLAVMLAKIKNIPVLLGSATPSLETQFNIQQGRYTLFKLLHRAGGSQLPVCQVWDIRHQKLFHGLSQRLIDTMGHHLAQQGQVLVFLNRRGYAPVMMCHQCGWMASCLHCDTHLVFHQARQRLICHHCAREQQPIRICQSCQQSELAAVGLGTEQLEQALAQLFPDVTIARVDRDTTSHAHALDDLLSRIQTQQVQLLVGTQMLAKGHHFPGLSLVALVDIDSGLFSGDFRAIEHTAQLVTQVAGRAGRMKKQGEVIVQTRQPDHPMLTALFSGYGDFCQLLLQERQRLGWPPFSHIALLRVAGKQQQQLQVFLEQWLDPYQRGGERLEPCQGVWVLGPIPAVLPRKNNYFHFQVLFQASTRACLHPFLTALMARLRQSAAMKKLRWSLDVDPVEVLQ